MTKEAYIRAVMRNLRLPRKIKKRIKNDLLSDFTARMEAGETQEQIIKDMGTPDKVAAEFHENFAGQLLPQRTPLDWFLLIAGIFVWCNCPLEGFGRSVASSRFIGTFCRRTSIPRGCRYHRRGGWADRGFCHREFGHRFHPVDRDIASASAVWHFLWGLIFGIEERGNLPYRKNKRQESCRLFLHGFTT